MFLAIIETLLKFTQYCSERQQNRFVNRKWNTIALAKSQRACYAFILPFKQTIIIVAQKVPNHSRKILAHLQSIITLEKWNTLIQKDGL